MSATGIREGGSNVDPLLPVPSNNGLNVPKKPPTLNSDQNSVVTIIISGVKAPDSDGSLAATSHKAAKLEHPDMDIPGKVQAATANKLSKPNPSQNGIPASVPGSIAATSADVETPLQKASRLKAEMAEIKAKLASMGGELEKVGLSKEHITQIKEELQKLREQYKMIKTDPLAKIQLMPLANETESEKEARLGIRNDLRKVLAELEPFIDKVQTKLEEYVPQATPKAQSGESFAPAAEAVSIVVVPASANAATSAGSAGSGGQGIYGPAAASGPANAPVGVPGSEDANAAAAAAKAPGGASKLSAAELAKFLAFQEHPTDKNKNTSVQAVDIFNTLGGKIDPPNFNMSAEFIGSPKRILHSDVIMFKFQVKYTVSLNGEIDPKTGKAATITLTRDIFTTANEANEAQVIAQKFADSQVELVKININPNHQSQLGGITDANKKAYLEQRVLSFKLDDEGGGSFSSSNKALGSLDFKSTPYVPVPGQTARFKTKEQEILSKPTHYVNDFQIDKMKPGREVGLILKRDRTTLENLQRGPLSFTKINALRTKVEQQIQMEKNKPLLDLVFDKSTQLRRLERLGNTVTENDYKHFFKGFDIPEGIKFKGTTNKEKLKEAEKFLKDKLTEFNKQSYIDLYKTPRKLAYESEKFRRITDEVSSKSYFDQIKKSDYLKAGDATTLSEKNLKALNEELLTKFGIQDKFIIKSTVADVKKFLDVLEFFREGLADKDLKPEDLSTYNAQIETLFGIKNQLGDQAKTADLHDFILKQQTAMSIPVSYAETRMNNAREALNKLQTPQKMFEELNVVYQTAFAAKTAVEKMKNDMIALKKGLEGKSDFAKDVKELEALIKLIEDMQSKHAKDLKDLENTNNLLPKNTPVSSPSPPVSGKKP